MKNKTKRAPNTSKTQTKNATVARRQQTIKLINEQFAFLAEGQHLLLAIFIRLQQTLKSNTQLDQIVVRRVNDLNIEKIVADLDYLAGMLETAAAFATTERKMSVDECDTLDELILRAAAKIDVKPIREFTETLQRDLVNFYTAAKKAKA